MLEHEADIALADAARERILAVELHLALSGQSRPAMMRSSVVLPDPDGPSSATNSPDWMSRFDVVERGEGAEALGDVDEWRCVIGIHSLLTLVVSSATLATSVTSASSASSEATANDGHELILVVENFDMQRHGVGLAANVAGHDRHRAELAHGARVAQKHAVEQRPFHVRQGHAQEGPQARRAERERGLLLLRALLLHQRDQFARDERKRDEHRRQHDAGQREYDLDVVLLQPGPEIALRAEQQHEHQTRDHR